MPVWKWHLVPCICKIVNAEFRCSCFFNSHTSYIGFKRLILILSGNQSIKKIVEDFGTSIETVPSVTSLHAHYLFTVLYHLWWNIGNRISSGKTVTAGSTSDASKSPSICRVTENTGIPNGIDIGNRTLQEPVPDAEETVEVTAKLNQGLKEDSESADTEVDSAQKTMPVYSQDQFGSEIPTRTSRLEETLCKKLGEISRLLLSEPHAMLGNIMGRLRYIQSAVGRLVNQHAQGGHKGVSPPVEGLVSDKDEALFDSAANVVDTADMSKDEGSSATNISSGDRVMRVQQSVSAVDVVEETQGVVSISENGGLVVADLTSTGKVVNMDTDTNGLTTENGNESIIDEKRLPPETSADNVLPNNWDELMADVKYSHPAVTYTMLLEEQGKLLQDLKHLEEDTMVSFWEPLYSMTHTQNKVHLVSRKNRAL